MKGRFLLSNLGDSCNAAQPVYLVLQQVVQTCKCKTCHLPPNSWLCTGVWSSSEFFELIWIWMRKQIQLLKDQDSQARLPMTRTFVWSNQHLHFQRTMLWVGKKMYNITWEQLSHCEHLDTSSLKKKLMWMWISKKDIRWNLILVSFIIFFQ